MRMMNEKKGFFERDVGVVPSNKKNSERESERVERNIVPQNEVEYVSYSKVQFERTCMSNPFSTINGRPYIFNIIYRNLE